MRKKIELAIAFVVGLALTGAAAYALISVTSILIDAHNMKNHLGPLIAAHDSIKY